MRANFLIALAATCAIASAQSEPSDKQLSKITQDLLDYVTRDVAQGASHLASQFTTLPATVLAQLLDIDPSPTPIYTNYAEFASATITSIPGQSAFSILPADVRSAVEGFQTSVLLAEQSIIRKDLKGAAPAPTVPAYAVAGGMMAAAAGAMAVLV